MKNHSFWISKRIIDIIICVLLIPLFVFLSFFLLFLNLFYNKGSIYYFQKRMGRNCKPFYAMKFRTMKEVELIERKYSDPLETDRITKLGGMLRKTKIDEFYL